MNRMKLQAALVILTTLGGCATATPGPNGQTPDISTQIQGVCNIVLPELAQMKADTGMSANQQKQIAAIDAVVSPICAAPPTTGQQAALQAVTGAVTQLLLLHWGAQNVTNQTTQSQK